MTTKIQDIINDPEYHWLLSRGEITPDVVRDSYFRSVVSQDPDFQGLNPLEQRRVRAAIMAIPDPPSEPLLQQYRASHPTGIQRVMGAVTPGKTAEDFAKQAAGVEKSAKVAEGIRAGVKAGATTGLGPFFGRRGGEIAGQATLGAVDEALFGLPKAALEGAYGEGAFPQSETGAEAVASGLGRLGGFFAGPVGAVKLGAKGLAKIPAAAKIASKLAPATYDTKRATEVGKYVTREAMTLSAAITAARSGDILAQRTLEDAAKEAMEAAAQGALMGGAFGLTKTLIPGTTPAQTLARIAVINAAFQGKDAKGFITGEQKLDTDRLASEAFETLLNSAFVIKGQPFPKVYEKSFKAEPAFPPRKPTPSVQEGGREVGQRQLPTPGLPESAKTRPLQTQMLMRGEGRALPTGIGQRLLPPAPAELTAKPPVPKLAKKAVGRELSPDDNEAINLIERDMEIFVESIQNVGNKRQGFGYFDRLIGNEPVNDLSKVDPERLAGALIEADKVASAPLWAYKYFGLGEVPVRQAARGLMNRVGKMLGVDPSSPKVAAYINANQLKARQALTGKAPGVAEKALRLAGHPDLFEVKYPTGKTAQRPWPKSFRPYGDWTHEDVFKVIKIARAGGKLTERQEGLLDDIIKAGENHEQFMTEEEISAMTERNERLLSTQPPLRGDVVDEELPDPFAGNVYSFPGPIGEILDTLGAAYTEQASKLIPIIHKTKPGRMLRRAFNPFADLPEREKLLMIRGKTEGKLGKVSEVQRKAEIAFNKLDDAEAKTAYEYMTSRAGDPNNTAEQNAAHAVVNDPRYSATFKEVREAKRLVRQIATAEHKRGLLSKESYDEYVDRYLPRVFLKYVMEGRETGLGAAKKMPMDRFRRRSDMTEEQLFALGEIKDPAYLAPRAIAEELRAVHLFDFLDAIAKEGVVTPVGPGTGPGWVDRNSLIEFRGRRYGRKAFSEFLGEQKEMLPARQQGEQAEATAMIQEMEQALAKVKPNPPDYDPKLYKEIPDTKAYGPLRGMVVRSEIADDIMNAFTFASDPTWVDKLTEATVPAMRVFKTMKVVMNPPGQIRNAVANSQLLYLGGVGYDKQIRLDHRAWDEMLHNGTIWNLSKFRGIGEGTFSAQEIRSARGRFLAKQGRKHPLWKIAEAYRKVTDPGGRAYQAVEAHFKLIKVLDTVEKAEAAKGGKLTTAELHEAVDLGVLEANRIVFDYSLVPRSIRQLRNSPLGAPFITFTYKAIPFLAETALKTPWRFLPALLLLPKLLEYATKQIHDLTEDEYKTLVASMTKYMKDQNAVYLIPIRNVDGSWRFVNFGYFLPWTPVQEIAQAAAKGSPAKLTKEIGVLGGPIPQIIQAVGTGTDAFTGRKIWDEYDPPSRKFLKGLAYAWNMAVPPFIGTYGFTGRTVKALSGQGDQYQGLGPDMGGALATLFGVNTYRIAPQAQKTLYLSQLDKEFNNLSAEMNQALGEGDDKRAEYIRSRIEELIEEAEEVSARDITPAIRER